MGFNLLDLGGHDVRSEDGGQRGEVLDAPEGEHGDAQQGGGDARGGDALPRPGEPVPDDDGGDEPWRGVSDVGLGDGGADGLGLGVGEPAERVSVHVGREEVE